MSVDMTTELLNITKVVEMEIANILVFSRHFFSDLFKCISFFLVIFYRIPQQVAFRKFVDLDK